MEKIVGSLVGVSYHAFDIVYDLLFTTERVIAFIIQHPNDIPHQHPSMMEDVFFGSMLRKPKEKPERVKIAQERRRSLQEKPLDELVALHPSNFEVRYSAVTSVEVTRGLFQSQLMFNISSPSAREQKVRFSLSKKQIPDAQGLLDLVLLSKIKEK